MGLLRGRLGAARRNTEIGNVDLCADCGVLPLGNATPSLWAISVHSPVCRARVHFSGSIGPDQIRSFLMSRCQLFLALPGVVPLASSCRTESEPTLPATPILVTSTTGPKEDLSAISIDGRHVVAPL